MRDQTAVERFPVAITDEAHFPSPCSRVVELTSDSLVYSDPSGEQRHALAHLISINLLLAGADGRPRVCRMDFSDGRAVLVLDGGSNASTADPDRAAYGDFVRALHARLTMPAGRAPRLVAGTQSGKLTLARILTWSCGCAAAAACLAFLAEPGLGPFGACAGCISGAVQFYRRVVALRPFDYAADALPAAYVA